MKNEYKIFLLILVIPSALWIPAIYFGALSSGCEFEKSCDYSILTVGIFVSVGLLVSWKRHMFINDIQDHYFCVNCGHDENGHDEPNGECGNVRGVFKTSPAITKNLFQKNSNTIIRPIRLKPA